MSEAPNSSSEHSTALASARAELSSAQRELNQAEEEQAEALEAAMQAEEKLEQAQEVVEQLEEIQLKLRQHMQEREATLQQGLGNIRQVVDDATARLRQQEHALREYLDGAPGMAAATAFVQWQPESGRKITISELKERLTPSPETQQGLLRHFAVNDKSFCAQINRAAERLCAARTPMEVSAVMNTTRANIAGAYAEHLVTHALSPLFEKVDTQRVTQFDNGRCTRSDLIATGARMPLVLGRGERGFVPQGGSLGIEVKTGRPAYLRQQEEHLVFQAGGHRDCDASVTFCSRDVHELSTAAEHQLRRHVREAGSPLLAALPRKEDIDRLCWDFVRETAATQHLHRHD